MLELYLDGRQNPDDPDELGLYWEPSLMPQAEEELQARLSSATAAALVPAAAEAASTPEERELVARAMGQLRSEGFEL